MAAIVHKADKFLEAADEGRTTRKEYDPAMCAGCGKEPAAPGFALGVACRDKLGLPSDEEARKAAEAFTRKAAEQKRAAHQKHAEKAGGKRPTSPKKEVAVGDQKKPRQCVDCGASLEGAHANTRRCTACRDAVLQERKNIAKAKKRREESSDLPVGTMCPECGDSFADQHRMRIHFGMSHRTEKVGGTEQEKPGPVVESALDQLRDAVPEEERGEPTSDLLASVDSTEPTPVDVEPEAPVGVPSTLLVEVEISRATGEESIALDLEETFKILAGRIQVLEREYDLPLLVRIRRAITIRRPWRPYGNATASNIRAWLDAELEQQKRRRFRWQFDRIVRELEDAVFSKSDQGVASDQPVV